MTQFTGPTHAAGHAAVELDAHAEHRSAASMFSQMTKPRITLMVVITAYIGYELGRRGLSTSIAEHAAHRQAFASRPLFVTPDWVLLTVSMLGTALACMGASMLNQVFERDTDALMPRTAGRPIAAGFISARSGLYGGVALALIGVGLLAVFSNTLTAFLGAFTVVSYAWVYTPLKRLTSTCTIVGAVPGAMPPLMGYAAATGTLSLEAWILFAILFLWQLPHFLAIAWLYKDDYAAAGLPMLPVIDTDYQATCRQILLGSTAMLPVSLIPTALGMAGTLYFFTALFSGLVFLGLSLALIRTRTRHMARSLFFWSIIYLPLVFAVLVYDRP